MNDSKTQWKVFKLAHRDLNEGAISYIREARGDQLSREGDDLNFRCMAFEVP